MSKQINFEELLKSLGKALDYSIDGERGMEEADAFVRRNKAHPLLGEALDVLDIKSAVKGELNLGTILEEDAKWAAKAEQLLGYKLPKIGMAQYFLVYLQNLHVANMYREIEDEVSNLKILQLTAAIPLAAIAASARVKVSDLPVWALRNGGLKDALEVQKTVNAVEKLKQDVLVAEALVGVLGIFVPAIFGYLNEFSRQVDFNRDEDGLLKRWKAQNGASKLDLERAKKLAQDFYRESVLNRRVSKVAESKK